MGSPFFCFHILFLKKINRTPMNQAILKNWPKRGRVSLLIVNSASVVTTIHEGLKGKG